MVTKEKELKKILSIADTILSIPYRNIWSSYDKKADVLYINFKKSSHADDTVITDDEILIRYEKGKIIGITILNASKRKKLLNIA